MITDGLSIIEYLAANAEQYLRAYGFETTFEGHKVYAINRALINSDFFESIDASKYDMFIGFSFNGSMFQQSYILSSCIFLVLTAFFFFHVHL